MRVPRFGFKQMRILWAEQPNEATSKYSEHVVSTLAGPTIAVNAVQLRYSFR